MQLVRRDLARRRAQHEGGRRSPRGRGRGRWGQLEGGRGFARLRRSARARGPGRVGRPGRGRAPVGQVPPVGQVRAVGQVRELGQLRELGRGQRAAEQGEPGGQRRSRREGTRSGEEGEQRVHPRRRPASSVRRVRQHGDEEAAHGAHIVVPGRGVADPDAAQQGPHPAGDRGDPDVGRGEGAVSEPGRMRSGQAPADLGAHRQRETRRERSAAPDPGCEVDAVRLRAQQHERRVPPAGARRRRTHVQDLGPRHEVTGAQAEQDGPIPAHARAGAAHACRAAVDATRRTRHESLSRRPLRGGRRPPGAEGGGFEGLVQDGRGLRHARCRRSRRGDGLRGGRGAGARFCHLEMVAERERATAPTAPTAPTGIRRSRPPAARWPARGRARAPRGRRPPGARSAGRGPRPGRRRGPARCGPG